MPSEGSHSLAPPPGMPADQPGTGAPSPRPADWTLGPAKFAAVLVLAAASLVALGLSVLQGRERPVLSAPPERAASVQPPPLAPGPDAAQRAASRDAPSSLGRRVNINTASAAELEILPGIGPALARRIVDDREASGPFPSLDHLDRVKGIGPRTIDKLRPLACAE